MVNLSELFLPGLITPANNNAAKTGLLYILLAYIDHYSSLLWSSGCDLSHGDTVRLIDGPINSAGRIEYCDNDQWHAICDMQWGDSEAQVVCTELGFPSASTKLLLASTV